MKQNGTEGEQAGRSQFTHPSAFSFLSSPRFDIMGHLMLDTVGQGLDMVRALTAQDDGIDGSKAYFYGEGERDQDMVLTYTTFLPLFPRTLPQAGSLAR